MSSPPLWRQIQKENFTSVEKLASYLMLTATQQACLYRHREFPLSLPKRLAQKIEKGTLTDPILLQFVPLQQETIQQETFIPDPVGDTQAALSPKYLHKYNGRALVLTTGACAMHCRYCFRKEFSYAPLQTGFAQEVALVQNDSSITEVILSGGDPLSLSNQQLADLLLSLSASPHLRRIRFHTRFPIGIPERIDEEFRQILSLSPQQIWFVIHCNHPRELDEEVLAALHSIQLLGIPVLNQSVLLQGVNDSTEVLQQLSEKLIDHGILPYYLHQLDRVVGATHFAVETERGKAFIEELSHALPGYGVPKYVQEIPSAPAKTPIR